MAIELMVAGQTTIQGIGPTIASGTGPMVAMVTGPMGTGPSIAQLNVPTTYTTGGRWTAPVTTTSRKN